MASPCHETAALKPHSHRANVVDTSHGEIKANRVPALAAIRHCSTRKIDMQIYAQILVILLTHPAALAMGSTGVCHLPSTPSLPFASPIHLTSFHLFSFSLPPLLATSFSLSFCLRTARFRSENAFFPSRRAPVRAAGLWWETAGKGRRWEMGERL